MKVRVFTIEGIYKLKSEEGDVLQMQPAAGWKTIRGAKAWAEKHGYEFVQKKEETKMASKARVISVDVLDDGSVIAYYSTGNTKAFKSVDVLPKTVKTWLDANGSTPVIVQATEAGLVIRTKEAAQEEPETAEDVAQLPALVDLPVIDTATDETVSMDAPQTHREPTRRLQTPQVQSLSLDIVDAIVSGLLMATRLSLIVLAYLLMGLASTCQAVGAAVEWMTPRAASLIDRSRAVWTETVRPACRTAAVWMAEAVWCIVI